MYESSNNPAVNNTLQVTFDPMRSSSLDGACGIRDKWPRFNYYSPSLEKQNSSSSRFPQFGG